MKDYFFLLGLGFVPGAVVASALVSSIQCAISLRATSTTLRLTVAALALPLYVVGTMWIGMVLLGEPLGIMDLREILEILPSMALLPFGILLPWASVSAYVLKNDQPVWWKAGLIGIGAVITGAVLWLALGAAVGAETN